jgi:hypothetical protein
VQKMRGVFIGGRKYSQGTYFYKTPIFIKPVVCMCRFFPLQFAAPSVAPGRSSGRFNR